MAEHADAIVEFFSGPRDSLETLLLVVSILVWLGYLALRYSRKSRIPVVTAFLLLGIALGPSGLGLVNYSLMYYLRMIEPVALAMIAFAAGEQLRFTDLASLSRKHFLAIALETVLPVAIVATGAYFVTRRVEVALPVGAIAGTTGLATVITTLKESGAKGNFTKVLGVAVATDNVFAVLFFSLTLPLVIALTETGSILSLYGNGLLNIVASIAIGAAGGAAVSYSVRKVRSSHELSMLVLAYVLLVAGVTEYLHLSVLLAGLAMGTTAANLTKEERDRERVFDALGPLEYPVFAVFFLWAGASLHLSALGTIGWVFGVYLVGRAVGKLAGPVLASVRLKWNSADAVQSRSLGVALLPQAGAAVGLAVIARDTMPASGELILATVLAAVVVFELVGPLGVHWAAKRAGEAREWSSIEPLTLDEALKELESRKSRVVVLRQSDIDLVASDVPHRMAARMHAELVEIPVVLLSPAPVQATSGGAGSPANSATQPANGATQPANGATQPANGATQPVNGAVQPANGATQPQNGANTSRSPIQDDAAGSPVLVLHPQRVADFLDVVSELKPDVLFLSLPRKMRQLLGSAEALGERVGCPIFDLPIDRSHRWVDAVSSRLVGADEAIAKVSSRWRTEWQPKLLSRLTDRDTE